MVQSPFKSILITGASSGIGLALARNLAAPGINLTVTGQNPERLETTKSELASTGAAVTVSQIDANDRSGMTALVNEADDKAPLDLVVANAGVSAGRDDSAPADEQAIKVMSTNVMGVMNTVLPAKTRMTKRGHGQIAIVSSLAGFRGLPTAPTYSASKVAVRAWGEAMRPSLKSHGVGLTLIFPGFVESRITDQNDFPMPFLMSAERAADIITRGLIAGKDTVSFPWQMILMMKSLSLLPQPLFDRLLSRGPKKI